MRAEWLTPVVRVRVESGGVDEYGDTLPGQHTLQDMPPALFAPGRTSEPVQAGAMPVITAPTVYWRGQHPDVKAGDKLIVGGWEYEVEGEPKVWPMGLEVALKAVKNRE
jgi:hypothetical protein